MPAVNPTTTTTTVIKNSKFSQFLKGNWWAMDKGDQAYQYALAELLNFKSLFVRTYVEQRRFGAVYSDRYYDSMTSTMSFNRQMGKKLLSLNVVSSCVDTLSSKICKNDVSVQYTAEGGDIDTEERASNLEFVVQNYMNKRRINKHFHHTFKDGAIYGTGMTHMRQHNITNQYIFESVKPYELFFDMNNAAYGNLYNFQIARAVSRYELLKEYPSKEEIISVASTIPAIHATNFTVKDTVSVVYAYDLLAHKRLVYCDSGCLSYEDFKLGPDKIYSNSPLLTFRYETDDRNWFGVGVTEKIFSNQLELNKLLRSAQRATNLMSVPKILYNTACGAVKSAFNNEIGTLIQWSGTIEPKAITLGQVPVDLFRQIDSWYTRSFEEIGLSQMSAQSRVPASIESGKGLSTYYHIESERFQMTGQRYEELAIDFNNLFVDFINKSLEDDRVPEDLQYVYGRDMKKLSLESISMSRDEFVIRPYPINDLPHTPADKLAQVQNMINMQMTDARTARKLMKMPDIDNDAAFKDSEYDSVMKQISSMAKGTPAEPSELNNMQLAADLSNQGYFFYRNRGLAPDKLALIARYNAVCLSALKSQQMAMQQEQMAMQIDAQQKMAEQMPMNGPSQ